MSVNFSIGHIVRTYPTTDDAFEAGEVVGFDGEKIVICEIINGYRFPDQVISRFKVEMFSFMGKNGMYEIDDIVTVYGYEGTWKVEKFAQNPRSTESEWCAALLHENGLRRLFWPAHLLMKDTNGNSRRPPS
ncbi:hypothetical protein [Acinetobacter sp.]|uniref:hypothetical protein n=1 Tax=Acinetobacter sp. TaxID=472 RepID=UPI00388E5253